MAIPVACMGCGVRKTLMVRSTSGGLGRVRRGQRPCLPEEHRPFYLQKISLGQMWFDCPSYSQQVIVGKFWDSGRPPSVCSVREQNPELDRDSIHNTVVLTGSGFCILGHMWGVGQRAPYFHNLRVFAKRVVFMLCNIPWESVFSSSPKNAWTC
jgi:hypothetical protein